MQIPQVVWDVPRGLKSTVKADQSPVVPSLASLQRRLINILLLTLVAHTKSLIPSLPYTRSYSSPLHRVAISNVATCSLKDGTETALHHPVAQEGEVYG